MRLPLGSERKETGKVQNGIPIALLDQRFNVPDRDGQESSVNKGKLVAFILPLCGKAHS